MSGSNAGLSRRKLMAVALAAPVIAPGLEITELARGAVPDPLIAMAAEWIAGQERIEAMTCKWQDLETKLFAKARAMRVKPEKLCRSRLPEARTMRALSRKIEATYRDLERSAAEIREIAAVSVEGAIAKVELGLKVQGRFDWRDNALELAEDGIAELRVLMGRR